jgi:hypothetical protein
VREEQDEGDANEGKLPQIDHVEPIIEKLNYVA